VAEAASHQTDEVHNSTEEGWYAMTDHLSDTGEAGEPGTACKTGRTGKTGPNFRLGEQRQRQADYPSSKLTVQFCTVINLERTRHA
jgi:hypothetical protein